MSKRNSVKAMRESFEAQFEVAGEARYLYRKNQKGEPIPVSAEERNRFVRQYASRIRLIMGGMVAGLLGFMGFFLWWTISSRSANQVPLYVGLIAITAVSIGLMYWVRGAPARALDGRMSVGRERTREEMQAIFFRKLSYGQLAGGAATGVIIVATRAAKENLFVGWHRAWLAVGAVLVLLSAVQAFRKWRFESDHPEDG